MIDEDRVARLTDALTEGVDQAQMIEVICDELRKIGIEETVITRLLLKLIRTLLDGEA